MAIKEHSSAKGAETPIGPLVDKDGVEWSMKSLRSDLVDEMQFRTNGRDVDDRRDQARDMLAGMRDTEIVEFAVAVKYVDIEQSILAARRQGCSPETIATLAAFKQDLAR